MLTDVSVQRLYLILKIEGHSQMPRVKTRKTMRLISDICEKRIDQSKLASDMFILGRCHNLVLCFPIVRLRWKRSRNSCLRLLRMLTREQVCRLRGKRKAKGVSL